MTEIKRINQIINCDNRTYIASLQQQISVLQQQIQRQDAIHAEELKTMRQRLQYADLHIGQIAQTENQLLLQHFAPDGENQRLRRQISQLNQDLRFLKSQRNFEAISQLDKMKQSMQLQITQLEGENTQNKQQILSLTAQSAVKDERLREIELEMSRQLQQSQVLQSQKEEENEQRLRQTRETANTQLNRLSGQIQALQDKLSSSQADMEATERNKASLQEHIEFLQNGLTVAVQEKELLASGVETELRTHNAQIAERQQEIVDFRQKVVDLQTENAKAERKHQLILQNMHRQHELELNAMKDRLNELDRKAEQDNAKIEQFEEEKRQLADQSRLLLTMNEDLKGSTVLLLKKLHEAHLECPVSDSGAQSSCQAGVEAAAVNPPEEAHPSKSERCAQTVQQTLIDAGNSPIVGSQAIKATQSDQDTTVRPLADQCIQTETNVALSGYDEDQQAIAEHQCVPEPLIGAADALQGDYFPSSGGTVQTAQHVQKTQGTQILPEHLNGQAHRQHGFNADKTTQTTQQDPGTQGTPERADNGLTATNSGYIGRTDAGSKSAAEAMEITAMASKTHLSLTITQIQSLREAIFALRTVMQSNQVDFADVLGSVPKHIGQNTARMAAELRAERAKNALLLKCGLEALVACNDSSATELLQDARARAGWEESVRRACTGATGFVGVEGIEDVVSTVASSSEQRGVKVRRGQ